MAQSNPSFPPIRACLFDMDGLLIDSEDIYTLVTNTILQEYGKPKLPWSIKAQLQGRPGPEEWAQLPLTKDEFQLKNFALQQERFPSCQPLPGVPELLKALLSRNVHIALATSSMERNYKLKTSNLGSLFSLFPDSQKVLGDDPRIPQGRGKPAPDIYQLALSTVNDNLRAKGEPEIKPNECLVFEDSVPGVEAGRRAGMRVIWCPHPELLGEFKGREDEVLAGLTSYAEGDIIEEDTGSSAEKVAAGWPGQLKDGWAELYHSLENFDVGKYVEVSGKDKL